MSTLLSSIFSLLLMGLIAAAALVASIRRRGGRAPSSWWNPVSRAFAGAGAFVALGLCYFILYYKHGLWRWALSLPTDELGSNEYGGALLGLVLVDIGVLSFLFKPLRRDWRPPEATELDRRPAGFLLLLGLAISLWVPWMTLFELAPHLLDALGGILLHVLPARIVTDLGLMGWIGYAGLTCIGMHPSDVATQGLNLLAGVTLLLWLFDYLWGRLVKEVPAMQSLKSKRRHHGL